MSEKRIILAADGLSLTDTIDISKQLKDRLYAVKIHDLFDVYGNSAIHSIRLAGAPKVWVDAKLHDIPATVRRRRDAIVKNGARIVTVHAAGGVEMMRAAVEGTYAEIYAVTMLTSLSKEDVESIHNRPLGMIVVQYATWAKEAGVTGLVCSAHEVKMLRSFTSFQDLKLIVPGTRSKGVGHNDQKRVATPLEAMRDGATHLVVGRQITEAANKVAAFDAIEKEIEEVL